MNTTDFLSIANAICPQRNLMVFDGQSYSYEFTNKRINKLANGLRNMGLKKGDRIGMLQVNCPQYVETYFASAKVGAIFVPLNFRAKAEELNFVINNSAAKFLFSGQRYLPMLMDMLSTLPTVKHLIALEGTSPEGVLSYEDILNSSSSEDIIGDIDDDDVTIIMYTSGTTGRPKGVPQRHSGFASYVLENVEPANPDIEEKNLLTVPLYHVAGMQAMLAAVYGGRTLVLMRQFETEDWLRLVQDEKATRAMLIPTMLKWIIEHPDFEQYDLSSLRIITYGAAPMPLDVIRKAIDKMPWIRFINAFGQTETASTISALGPDDHVIEGSEEEIEKKLKRLTSSIGKPLSDVEIKITDQEGKELPPLEVGEIMARGPRVMTGYWEDEEKTRKAITEDGWLHTGDRGWLDQDGYIYLAGREDDLIIRGGENISPEEVENVLCSFPKIDEAACIGVPDPEWGQEVRAILVLKKGETSDLEEILEFCKDKLAGFKRPKSMVFINALPRNHMGKILKNELRERYGQQE